MAKSLPPLTWFRAFEAAARLLSTTAAARDIGLTQSAISQQIRALEGRLGVVLFHRHARGLTLSDEGRKLLPQVEAALETLSQAAARYDADTPQHQITVAASLSVIEWVVAPGLPDFLARHPGVSVRFTGTIWPDEYAVTRADVEIRFGSDRQVGEGAHPLRPDGLITVATPDVAARAETAPLIETLGTSTGWAAWQDMAGTARRAPDIFVDAYGPALTLASHGAGVALVSRVIAKDALQSGQVVRIGQAEMAAVETYFLAVPRRTAEATAFADWVQTRVRAPEAPAP